MRFDWYQATVVADLPPSVILDRVGADLPAAFAIHHGRRGQNGYAKTAILVDRDEHALVTMNYDGNQGAPPNLRGTGPDAPSFAHTLRSLRLAHRVTRGDVCEDLEGENYHKVADDCRLIAKRHGMSGLTYVPDDPDRGSTYKLGADTSSIKARVYRKDLEMIKKGCDPSEFPQPIVRFEAEVRPKGQALRMNFSTYEPEHFLGAARWLRAIASELLDQHPAAIVMQKRLPTEYERQVTWLRTQAHKALSAVYARHPTHEELGRFIVDDIIKSW
jgi:DNA relaxase NicK